MNGSSRGVKWASTAEATPKVYGENRGRTKSKPILKKDGHGRTKKYGNTSKNAKSPNQRDAILEWSVKQREDHHTGGVLNKDEHWRKHGKLCRARLIAKDEEKGTDMCEVNDNFKVVWYFSVASKVLKQVLEEASISDMDLKETYVIGHRLVRFLSVVLPTHEQYFSEDPHICQLRSSSQDNLVQLLQYLEDLAHQIDEEEYNKFIISDLTNKENQSRSQTRNSRAEVEPQMSKINKRNYNEQRRMPPAKNYTSGDIDETKFDSRESAPPSENQVDSFRRECQSGSQRRSIGGKNSLNQRSDPHTKRINWASFDKTRHKSEANFASSDIEHQRSSSPFVAKGVLNPSLSLDYSTSSSFDEWDAALVRESTPTSLLDDISSAESNSNSASSGLNFVPELFVGEHEVENASDSFTGRDPVIEQSSSWDNSFSNQFEHTHRQSTALHQKQLSPSNSQVSTKFTHMTKNQSQQTPSYTATRSPPQTQRNQDQQEQSPRIGISPPSERRGKECPPTDNVFALIDKSPSAHPELLPPRFQPFLSEDSVDFSEFHEWRKEQKKFEKKHLAVSKKQVQLQSPRWSRDDQLRSEAAQYDSPLKESLRVKPTPKKRSRAWKENNSKKINTTSPQSVWELQEWQSVDDTYSTDPSSQGSSQSPLPRAAFPFPTYDSPDILPGSSHPLFGDESESGPFRIVTSEQWESGEEASSAEALVRKSRRGQLEHFRGCIKCLLE